MRPKERKKRPEEMVAFWMVDGLKKKKNEGKKNNKNT
jgi:hypothetical protein